MRSPKLALVMGALICGGCMSATGDAPATYSPPVYTAPAYNVPQLYTLDPADFMSQHRIQTTTCSPGFNGSYNCTTY